ncbi:DUF2274 domain-containing protein [Stappia sp. P2PMeth1]|uniref:DUF2274 domain-containing protein n=1 Tax=Stappia sp. P2PMeth1 TaxID=2003586 RepID=UPI001644A597|nr:DUF2274 domain-containing protein [Stappia sp. P2PMeth1]
MKLRLGPIEDEKPIKVTVELPAQLHEDLIHYAEILARESLKNTRLAPDKLIVPMLAKFIAGDRAFAKAKRHQGRSTV